MKSDSGLDAPTVYALGGEAVTLEQNLEVAQSV